MKKKLCLMAIIAGIMICIMPKNVSAGNETVDLTGFNRDIIAENVPVENYSNTFDLVNNYAFYSEDNTIRTPDTPTGFPSSGLINSVSTPGLVYNLQSYDSNNAFFLNGVSNGTLTFSSPDSYANLYLLATSANGSSDIGIKINFTDGTNTVFYERISYWYYGIGVFSYNDLGRINTQTGIIEGSISGPPRLFEVFLDLSAYSHLKISSVNIYNYRPTQAAIFAISSYTRDLLLPTLSNETVDENGSVVTLNATPTDGDGSYTYQWYRNDTNDTNTPTILTGETNAAYTPSSSMAGTFYYFCTVTETTGNNESVETNVMTLTVKPIVDAETPNITVQPSDVECNIGDNKSVSITASVLDDGILSYQWYSNMSNSNSSGSLISGATSHTYTIPTSNTGTIYYYCEVTNTNKSVNGNKTATATSETAEVIVDEVDVVDINFDIEYNLVNERVTELLINICPYTILPSNATNTTVTWHSSNPSVASITSNIITSHSVGITTITVTTEDGGFSDTMTIEVKDSDATARDCQYGFIGGQLVDSNNQPLSGYIISIYSNPKTTTTDNNGRFSYPNIPFTNHTLVINKQTPTGYTEVGRCVLNIIAESTSSISINSNTNIINIIYSDNTEGIDLRLQTNESQTNFEVIATVIENPKATVIENPKTGDNGFNPLWCSLLLLLPTLAMFILLRWK